MTKKEYIAPAVEVVAIKTRISLLAESGGAVGTSLYDEEMIENPDDIF